MSVWIGIIGMILIVAGWIPQTVENIRRRKTDLNLKFILLYFLGSVALLAYSVIIKDLVFLILNGVASGQALINLIIELGEKKK